MANDRVLMYGTRWCGQCHRARAYLGQQHIPYDFIDIDADGEGRRFVEQTNRGMRSVPTIVFPDGSILVEPSRRQLAGQLGIAQKNVWERLMSWR